MRQRDVDDHGSLLLQRLERPFEGDPHFGVDASAFRDERTRDADTHPFDPTGQRSEVIVCRGRRARRVSRIGTGDHLQAQGRVGYRGRKWPDLIE